MPAKTFHVYRSNGNWAIKKEGKQAETFGTKREAVAMAIRRVKDANSGQIVVYGKDGQIIDYRAYGMPRVQDPPKPPPLGAKRIARAVSKVVWDRLHSDPFPSRAQAPAK